MPWLTVLRPLAVLAAVAAAALLLDRTADRLVHRAAARHPASPAWPLLRRCRPPFLLTLAAMLLLGVEPGLGLAARRHEAVRHLLVLTAIAGSAWLASRIAALLLDTSFSSYAARRQDAARVRRVRTQTAMLRRVTVAAIAVVALAAMLMTFPGVRAVGASLLASAGLIGLVAGVAAQSTLANLFAGIQLAFGDMVRIGDEVVVVGDWGTVEEITLTYVVIATWDQRRIVMPVSYFAGKPFENWSRNDPSMTGTILLHLDHSTPVAELRQEFETRLRKSDLWDGRGCALQVVDTTPTTIVVRALMTARNASDAFDLRCLIREELVAHLRSAHPYALPRIGVAQAPVEPRPAVSPPAQPEPGGRVPPGRAGLPGMRDGDDRSGA
ncbi:mechanosensitive ion channel family protein [Kitasatospora sp. NPDC050543]|uniref:mechanosensitive ion channel family protein n=1 Tax=Kitasatospora sp. NPDC050543 TaxID=3364054 RepID=UPI003791F97C